MTFLECVVVEAVDDSKPIRRLCEIANELQRMVSDEFSRILDDSPSYCVSDRALDICLGSITRGWRNEYGTKGLMDVSVLSSIRMSNAIP